MQADVAVHRVVEALGHGADIVIMVHPDYQYTPKLIPAMAGLVASDLYACVLASRILGGGALKGGMPLWRYVSNRALTAAGNMLLGTELSEFHTGYALLSPAVNRTRVPRSMSMIQMSLPIADVIITASFRPSCESERYKAKAAPIWSIFGSFGVKTPIVWLFPKYS